MSDWGKVVHNPQRGHYAVKGTWQGKRLYFSQYQTIIGPLTCETWEIAERLRLAINSDIDQGIFNPSRYQHKKPLHLKQYSETWLEEIRPNLAKGSWHQYEKAMRLYIVPTIGHRFLPDIGHADLKNCMKAMVHLSPKTKKNHMGALHRMMVEAMRDGHISQLPPWIEFRGKNEVVSPAIIYLSIADQISILSHVPERHRHIFMFMMATGCRPSEARALRKKDVTEKQIMFAVSFGYRGELKEVKNKKAEPFPVYPELRAILESTPKFIGEWFFVNPDTKTPYSKDINRIWNKACTAAGVQPIRLYNAVRHSYACQLINNGVEKAVVSRLLRHSDPRMVEKYAFYETASLEVDAGKVKRFCKQAANNAVDGILND